MDFVNLCFLFFLSWAHFHYCTGLLHCKVFSMKILYPIFSLVFHESTFFQSVFSVDCYQSFYFSLFSLSIFSQGPVEEPKNFSKAPGSYHWALVIFIIFNLILFLNEFLLTTGNNNFLKFQLFKTFDIQKKSPRCVLLEEGVLQNCYEFSSAREWFEQSCKTTLLELRICTVAVLWVCFMFAEHFWRTDS